MLYAKRTRYPFFHQLEQRLLLTQADGNPCEPDSALGDDIHGDSIALATRVPAEVERNSFIDEPNDVDVFRYDAIGSRIGFFAFSIKDIEVGVLDANGDSISPFTLDRIGALGDSLQGYFPFASKGQLVFGSVLTKLGEPYFITITAEESSEYTLFTTGIEPPRISDDPVGFDDGRRVPEFGLDRLGGRTFDDAAPLELNSYGGLNVAEVTSYIDENDDVDFFSFQSDGNEIRIDLQSRYGFPITVQLLGAGGNEVASFESSGDGPQRINETLTVNPFTSYVVAIRAAEATDYTLDLLTRFNDEVRTPGSESDIDGNGTKDFADFLILANNFGQDVDSAFSEGDLNGDAKVDFSDFLIFAQDFERPER